MENTDLEKTREECTVNFYASHVLKYFFEFKDSWSLQTLHETLRLSINKFQLLDFE